MFTATVSSQIAGLHIQLLDTDARIDRALDRGSRREFMLWVRRRSSLASRLQNLLITVAINA
jgi:hypothetical protein